MGVYDKTLREIFNNVPVNLIKLLTNQNISKHLNPSFPNVKEREVDFLVELENGDIFHLEIQSINDNNMPQRMLFYALLIEEKFNKFPIQAVLYVGDDKLRISNTLKRKNLIYEYKVFDIKNIDCNYLIESDSVEDNILAILCNIKKSDNLLEKIMLKLLNLPEKERADYLRKLIILARLRPKLYNKLENYYKEKKMPIVLDPKNDPLYNKGWNEAWSEAWSEAVKKTKIKDAIIMIKEFKLPVDTVAVKFNIPINDLKEALNEIK